MTLDRTALERRYPTLSRETTAIPFLLRVQDAGIFETYRDAAKQAFALLDLIEAASREVDKANTEGDPQ